MPSFIGFELTIVGLFLVVGWHATRNTICHRVEYLLAFLYALMFEELDIRLFHTYQYSEGYTLVLGQVPIVIALAWAVILYTSMAMSDSWEVSDSAKACLDALLAVLIDVSIDAIAIRRGYWQWQIPLSAGWFGVPAGNLYAWMFVVFFFSLWCRKLRRWVARNPYWLGLASLVPPLAYLCLMLSLVAVGTLNAVLQLDETTKLISVLAVAIAFLAGCLHGLRKCPTRERTPITPLIAYVRLGLHGFFLLELLLSGLVTQTPWLLVVAVSALLIEVVLHHMISPEHAPR